MADVTIALRADADRRARRRPMRPAARALVARLGETCDFYKVGLELFTAEGPAIVEWLRGEGKRVFLDLKLHDIPNTVRSAARSAARHGASLLTIHASGGVEMIAAAVDGARAVRAEVCQILGVTILTSLDGAGVGAGLGAAAGRRRIGGAASGGHRPREGAAGIVCSGHEAAAVHAVHGRCARAADPRDSPAGRRGPRPAPGHDAVRRRPMPGRDG